MVCQNAWLQYVLFLRYVRSYMYSDSSSKVILNSGQASNYLDADNDLFLVSISNISDLNVQTIPHTHDIYICIYLVDGSKHFSIY